MSKKEKAQHWTLMIAEQIASLISAIMITATVVAWLADTIVVPLTPVIPWIVMPARVVYIVMMLAVTCSWCRTRHADLMRLIRQH